MKLHQKKRGTQAASKSPRSKAQNAQRSQCSRSTRPTAQSSKSPQPQTQNHRLSAPVRILILLLVCLLGYALLSSLALPLHAPLTQPMQAYAATPADRQVSTAQELINAYNAAPSTPPGNETPFVIELTADITMPGELSINNRGKNIMLIGEHALIAAHNSYAVVVMGKLIIDGPTITHAAGYRSEGIFISGGHVTLLNGSISGNQSRGGVFLSPNPSATLIMEGGEISNNSSNSSGGGVFMTSSDTLFIMNGGKITNNTARFGGGVFGYYGTFTMNDGEISGNGAAGDGAFGGGVAVDNTAFTVNGGTISGNTAPFGGGIANAYGSTIINGGAVMNNNANYGAGVFNFYGGTVTMQQGVVSGNTATAAGGGVYNYNNGGDSSFVMQGGEISGNTAQNGAGITSLGLLSLEGGVINNNVAANNGGGIYPSNYGKLDIAAAVSFSGNRAAQMYDRDRSDPADPTEALYREHVKATVWSTPFTQGYNNYDIYYESGEPVSIVTLTFDPHGGTLTGDEQLSLLSSQSAGSRFPTDPTRLNYNFDGWWTKDGSNDDWGVCFTASTVVSSITSSDITLYAKWLPGEEPPTPPTPPDPPGPPGPPGPPIPGPIPDPGYPSVFITPDSGTTPSSSAVERGPADATVLTVASENTPMAEINESSTREEILAQLKREGVPILVFGGLEMPLHASGYTKLVMAALNLILVIAGALLAFMALIRLYASRRPKAPLASKAANSTHEKTEQKSWKPAGLAATIALGVAGVLVFFLTEDMSRLWVLTDTWTILQAALFAAGILVYRGAHARS